MKFETIIEPTDAFDHRESRDWVFVDCRFTIREPDRGEREYGKSHVVGAVYAHLDRDLSGPVITGATGRHPLPHPEALVSALGGLGIDGRTQVVAYDESTGAMAAARLWWLLKWAGHDAVAVLNGGLARWRSLGFPCASGAEHRPATVFDARFRPAMACDAAQVLAAIADPAYMVLDSRAAERYQGLNETIDPVAGHIQGAFSAPYEENLRGDGLFKSRAELGSRFDSLAGARDASHTIFYCGSGVTAAHNVLSFAHAGRGIPLLYPGSWSEWITDPRRPIG